MRILHVITRMVHGGAQLNTLMCAAEQARRGHDVTLVSGAETGSEGSLLARAASEPFRLIVLPELVRDVRPRSDLKALLKLYRLMGEGFDVVHTHTSKAGFLGRWAAWARGIRLILHTPHGHVFHGYFPRPQERLFILLERLTARITHRLIMLTRGELRDHLQERIAPEKRFVVIPSGVEVERFSTSTRARGKRLGSLLRLVEVKGVMDLLEAFARMRERHPEATLDLAGDGPDRARVEALIRRLELGSSVRLHGHVEDVPGFLASLDLFVLPSHNEGMGRAVVEAMASGLAIVASDVSGLPDLVQDGQNGRLVPPRRPDLLAESLASLLDEPAELDRMGQVSRRRAGAFSAQVMYDRLEGIVSADRKA